MAVERHLRQGFGILVSGTGCVLRKMQRQEGYGLQEMRAEAAKKRKLATKASWCERFNLNGSVLEMPLFHNGLTAYIELAMLLVPPLYRR